MRQQETIFILSASAIRVDFMEIMIIWKL